ncbi:MAG: spinster family MFS transporter [Gammaproteobacteria bacterium]
MEKNQYTSATAPDVAAAGVASRRTAYYVLAVLTVASVVNLMDRQILAILLVPIQSDLKLSDTQMGLIAGPAFGAVYALAGLFLGRLADRWNRRTLIACAIAFWSAATAASAAVTSFAQLMATRMLVAIGESGSAPAAFSILSDLFPTQRRATVIGIMLVGSSAGLFLGMYLGGLLAEHYGWRTAFVLFGVPGLALALLVRLTVREPVRGAMDGVSRADADSRTAFSVLRYLFSLRTYQLLLCAASMHQILNAMWMAWMAAFLIRVHGFSTSEAGLLLGLGGGLGAMTGNLAGGYLSDRLTRLGPRASLVVPSVALLASTVPFSVFLLVESKVLLLVAFIPFAFCVSCAFGPALATGLALAKPHMRGFAASLYSTVTQLVGLTVGPLLIGALNDGFQPRYGDDAVRYSLSVVIVFAVVAAAVFLLASRTVARDVWAPGRDAA